MMGVDYNVFWILNPKTITPFIEAFALKEQHENSMAWISGMYIKMAIASSFNEKSKYPNEPFGVNVKEETPQERTKRIREKFLVQMEAHNMNFKNRKGGEDK